eukprot:1158440-Pelagomonas_calceolata.AAC.3
MKRLRLHYALLGSCSTKMHLLSRNPCSALGTRNAPGSNYISTLRSSLSNTAVPPLPLGCRAWAARTANTASNATCVAEQAKAKPCTQVQKAVCVAVRTANNNEWQGTIRGRSTTIL